MRKTCHLNYLLIVIIISFIGVAAQAADTTDGEKSYSYILQDSPPVMFTMRMIDEDYISSYRFMSQALNRCFKPVVSYMIQSAGFFLFFGAATHEEAHRSILNSKNIGSTSRPFLLSERHGYVDGVTDETLNNLLNSDFPTYIRLHTAGLESDYMLNCRIEKLLSFDEEDFRNVAVEYALRKAAISAYYLMGIVHYDIDGKEESNELERDVVGNDVYGAVRHLFRPAMEFKRYTRYSELTDEEKKFVHRVGYRSLFNLVSPNLIGINNFQLTDALKMNFALGYTMCPFGDFIDEKLWFKYRDTLKWSCYVREYQNKSRWFPAAGLGIYDIPILNNAELSVHVHIWSQPESLGFTQSKGIPGGAVEFSGRYFLCKKPIMGLKNVSLDIGVLLKSFGFLPEEMSLQKHFGFDIGTSFDLGK